MMTSMQRSLVAAALAVACWPLGAAAQVQTEVPPVVPGAKPVAVERIKIHGDGARGQPRGRRRRPGRHRLSAAELRQRDEAPAYPVVYALHGYSIGAEQWTQEIHVPQTIEGAFAQGAREMIVVLPDSKTAHNGSMYSSSVTTGDFERYISDDVVAYIDAHYRTMPNRKSRGLVGHSMGGYGATRIGMKHADVFGGLYIMSPCCLSARPGRASPMRISKRHCRHEDARPTRRALGVLPRAQLATAAAWSPNPKNPPLYLDLPMKNGAAAARNPRQVGGQRAARVHGSIHRQLAAIPRDLDRRRRPGWPAKRTPIKLHKALDRYGIANGFEIYSGTHTSRVADRFQNHVLPFFSTNLCFTDTCQ